ncbi:MAG: pyrimidine-nucleoside phosphorylase [Clostridiales bacterium]|nr:pyrimidine-nucleoside phosphorylase [Clostridiales bacterium]
MRMHEIIIEKRDGKELSREQIDWVIQGCTDGSIPDYQLSAWLMTIYFSGMTRKEMFALTDAMTKSGERIDLSSIPGVKVDKHSTGGVGDKTTLITGPIVAACGVPVAKMSGRGLGHTGGTVDKLESIPGFRTELSRDTFLRIVSETGISVIGQSENIAAADKKLYALRDVTGAIDSIPLIASSVMSKKIASGADAILLDVKTGRGAFMDSLDRSIRLARVMVSIGENAGRRTIALVTDMDEPLGFAIGNSLEVIEAIETLHGRGPADLQKVCLELAANMLLLAEKADELADCRILAEKALQDGSAFERFKLMTAAQGGDVRYLDDPGLFPKAPLVLPVTAAKSGFVEAVDALAVGNASLLLGAGRLRKEDGVDHRAGLLLKKKIGDWVDAGEVLAELYTDAEDKGREATRLTAGAFEIDEKIPAMPKLIHARVTAESSATYD